MRFKLLFLAFVLLLFAEVYSQQTQKYNNVDYTFQRAMDLYNNQMYGASQKVFSEVLLFDEEGQHLSYKDDAAFYIAMCALHLTNRNAEYLLHEYIEEKPESYNNLAAIFQMANYHFKNRKYKNALDWYEKIDRLSLPKEDLPEYHFKMGFSHFARKDYDKASKSFYEVKSSESIYGPMSLYFYSHIKYLNKQYQTALLGFEELKNHPSFSGIVPFYIIQIYYLQTKYAEIIEYAPAILESADGPRTGEVAKMIGSSYFKLGDYTNALKYLKQYHNHTRSTTDYDNYEYGFTLYMNNQYEEAASIFSRIVSMKDTLSQNAAYHMADCYLKLNKKNEAKLAFETASRYRFNDVIREDALFNFAQLSFELDINPFNQAITALTTYIDNYPNSPRIDKVYGLLIDAFWSTKNYKDAISIIDNMKNRSAKVNEAYQRLTFYRGLEHFTALKFNDAIKYFDKSLEHGNYNPSVRALSLYWKADAFYRKGEYNKSISLYEEFINSRGAVTTQEFDYAHYNIGYAFYNIKDYTKANTWFRKFEAQVSKPSTMLNDALNRIGDTYYINRNFSAAAEYYKKSVLTGLIETDYALYQMALAYGGQRMPQQKIWSLSRLIREYPNSEYAGNATYEIGRTYNVEMNKADSAKHYFNILLEKYPNSSMKRSTLSSLGSIYFNERKYENSLDCFKQIIALYPNTNEASHAIEMIKSIYIEMNKPDEYFQYASTNLEGYEISQDEQDSISFLAAKSLYIDQKFYPALEAFSNFLKRFPNSRNATEAHYYKAELHFHFDEKEAATNSYIAVADAPRGIFSEHSTLRAAGLLFDAKDYNKSFTYYNKLFKIAENKNNKLVAAIGRLRTSYLTENHDEVLLAAADVIENDRVNEEQQREAYYKMAKAHLAKEQNIRALSLFERLAAEVVSYEGAESKFRTAEINYVLKRDTIAENIIYDFAKMNSPQQYWIAKSFILLADIFYDRQDFFSAKHTLQSVLNNYSNETDGIKNIASDKLTSILEEEQAIQSTNKFLNLEFEITDEQE